MKAEEAHSAYKGLSEVEWAFRTMKTGLLEIRPPRVCAFVAMLAYAITQSLWKKTAHEEQSLRLYLINFGFSIIIPFKVLQSAFHS